MSDEIRRQIDNLKTDLKTEINKAIEMLRDTNSRLGRLEESKRELDNMKDAVNKIKTTLNSIEAKIDK